MPEDDGQDEDFEGREYLPWVPGGFQRGPSEVEAQAPEAHVSIAEMFAKTQGRFPTVLLRGFKEPWDATIEAVANAPHVLLVTTSNAGVFFSTSAAGFLAHALLHPLWTRWRKCAIVVASEPWINWWKIKLLEFRGAKLEPIKGLVVGGKLKCPSEMASHEVDDTERAEAVRLWFHAIQSLVAHSKEDDDSNDESDSSNSNDNDNDDDDNDDNDGDDDDSSFWIRRHASW